jgi:ribosome biogenesis GTPase
VLARADPETGRTQVLAANVDVVFVVTSPNRDLNARRLERFVALAVGGGCETVALLNKSDLVDDAGPALAAVRAAVGGEVPVVVCSALSGDGMDVVRSWLAPGRTVALLGTSGVGKSTLANALLGADVQATAAIRAVDDRGRDTTVRRELFELSGGALLIDTPGLKLPRMGADASVAFDELSALAESCRFGDCSHDGEPGCAVQAAIADGSLDPARLDALRQLQREHAWAESRADARERRRARRQR